MSDTENGLRVVMGGDAVSLEELRSELALSNDHEWVKRVALQFLELADQRTSEYQDFFEAAQVERANFRERLIPALKAFMDNYQFDVDHARSVPTIRLSFDQPRRVVTVTDSSGQTIRTATIESVG